MKAGGDGVVDKKLYLSSTQNREPLRQDDFSQGAFQRITRVTVCASFVAFAVAFTQWHLKKNATYPFNK